MSDAPIEWDDGLWADAMKGGYLVRSISHLSTGEMLLGDDSCHALRFRMSCDLIGSDETTTMEILMEEGMFVELARTAVAGFARLHSQHGHD